MPVTFAGAIAPCAPADFLTSFYGRELAYVEGPPDKFANLLPWSEVNRVLAQHRLRAPRLRLAKDGKILPQELYFGRLQKRMGWSPKLLPDELIGQLRDGATLIIDSVDELSEPVTELACEFERALEEIVQVNAYASWRPTEAFGRHWDDHEVFIFQVSGRKRWQAWRPTEVAPIPRDDGPAPAPTGAPAWAGELTAGDLLYLPRGWWHTAAATSGQSLQLTLGVSNRTGLDYLAWLLAELRASPLMRSDLPKRDPGELRSYVQALRAELTERVGDDSIAEYLRHRRANARIRTAISLPFGVLDGGFPADATVRWLPDREVVVDEERQVMATDAREFTFSKAGWALLAELSEHREVVLLDLEARLTDSVGGRTALDAGLLELLRAGLITVSQSPPPDLNRKPLHYK